MNEAGGKPAHGCPEPLATSKFPQGPQQVTASLLVAKGGSREFEAQSPEAQPRPPGQWCWWMETGLQRGLVTGDSEVTGLITVAWVLPACFFSHAESVTAIPSLPPHHCWSLQSRFCLAQRWPPAEGRTSLGRGVREPGPSASGNVWPLRPHWLMTRRTVNPNSWGCPVHQSDQN